MYENLWQQLRPGKPKAEHPGYCNAVQEGTAQELELEYLLCDEVRRKFDDMMELKVQTARMEADQAFADGYRLGARLMLEALGIYTPGPELSVALKVAGRWEHHEQ